jgi:hypothetical protein
MLPASIQLRKKEKQMKAFAFVVLAVVSVALVACGGHGASQDSSSSSAPAAAPNAAAPAAAAGEIGVPECDEFFKKYEACIGSKVPEAGRTALKQSIDASKAAFKQTAANAQAKASLPGACKQAMDSAKASTAAYGCSW